MVFINISRKMADKLTLRTMDEEKKHTTVTE